MSHQSLKSFIDLVTFDLRFVDIQNRKNQLLSDISTIEKQEIEERKQFELVGVKLRDIQKSVHESELHIQELSETEERLLKHLESLSSSKEYDAALKELEHCRLNRNQLEQKLLQQMNKAEIGQKDQNVFVQQHQEKLTEFTHALQAKNQELLHLQQELQGIETQRSEKVVGIPQDWIDTYEMMRGRVSNPVVPLLQESCSVCFYGVTPRDLQSIRNNYLIQCKECYRFLYEDALV